MTAAELFAAACESKIACLPARPLQVATTEGFVQAGGSLNFIPPRFTDILYWGKPSTLAALANNDPVLTWPDSGSRGNNINNTAGTPPFFQTGANVGVRFNGVDSKMDVSVVTTSVNYTLFLVVTHDAAAGTQGIVRVGENAGYGFFKTAGNRGVVHRLVADCVDGAATTTKELWSAVRTSTGPLLRFFLRGVNTAITNSTSAVLAPDGVIHMGRFSAAGLYFAGVIHEVAIYDVALSDADRDSWQQYLIAQHAVP